MAESTIPNPTPVSFSINNPTGLEQVVFLILPNSSDFGVQPFRYSHETKHQQIDRT